MSDFHQRGLISTLPRLVGRPLPDLEDQLGELAKKTAAALILPCTFDDLRQPAMRTILQETKQAVYFSHIVVSLNQATADDLPEAARILGDDPRCILLWNDNPALLALLPEMTGIADSNGGKGFNLWSAIGWLLHRSECQVAITHDTDILHYSRELPALLTLPLLDPALGYRFCKGYYPRLTDKSGGQLFGRVTRLFVGPLLRAIVRVEGHTPLLDFLDSFRYPLAGEFGGRLADLVDFAFPAGWGLEMDLLCSVHRTLPPENVAQIDLGSNYEHKHQILKTGSSNAGLIRLAAEISACLLRQLAREGVPITPDFLLALRRAYGKAARDTIRRYHHVALLNGLDFHEKQEITLVEAFSRFLQPPPDFPAPLPAWSEFRRSQPERSDRFIRCLTPLAPPSILR